MNRTALITDDEDPLAKLRRLYEMAKEAKSQAGDHASDEMQTESKAWLITWAVICILLGLAAVALNGLILLQLVRHRRRTLERAFYILIMNFTVIDSFKAICLILFVTKSFIAIPGVFKFDAYVLVFLRFCNLATVLNLLMITSNEYLFIKHPLKYHNWVRPRRVVYCIALALFVSALLTFLMAAAESTQTSMYIGPCPSSTTVGPFSAVESTSDIVASGDGNNKCIIRVDPSVDATFVTLCFMLVFCLGSLIVVIVCYIRFALVIHKIQKAEQLEHHQFTPNRSDMQQQEEASSSRNHNSSRPDPQNVDSRKQILRRHKYVWVIGLVILIDAAYLLSYSALKATGYVATHMDSRNLVLKRVLQASIGLHSVLQPLCYLRMREFRQFLVKAFGCEQKPDRRTSLLTTNYHDAQYSHETHKLNNAATLSSHLSPKRAAIRNESIVD